MPNITSHQPEHYLVIQIRAIRTLNGLDPQDTCGNSFKDLKILAIACTLFNGNGLGCCEIRTNKTSDQHAYSTRNKHNFKLDRHHLSL